METITIEATKHSPEVIFDSNGQLKIEGRSFPENASNFYDPLIQFAADLEDVKHATRGNLCRCGTHPHVFKAALTAAKKMK